MSHYDHDLREGEPPSLPVEHARHYPTHPLFPLAEGVRETKEIHEITFDRWSDKGVKERCPDRFSASDLTSLSQVIDLFGGGTYQFIAFDSRGNFSRWTPEKEKVRIELASKPFRQPERAEPPPQEIHQAPRAPATPMDFMGMLMQQSMAAQERADRLMAALMDRLATPPPVPPPPPPPPPAADPIAMLSGLATVLEKIRPAQGGDMVTQLSGLVSIVQQLKGSQLAESSSPSEDLALQPFLSMVTSAMMQKPGGAQQPAVASLPPPQPPSPPPADLVWVLLPEHGPVLMRHEQAARAFGRAPATASPPASIPSATGVTPPPVAAPLAHAAAVAPGSSPAPAPVAMAATPVPSAPAPVVPRPAAGSTHAGIAPSAPTAAAAPGAPGVHLAAPADAAPATERCIVCGEPGRRELDHSNVLICRHGHRSLIASPSAAPPPAAPTEAVSPLRSILPLDGGSFTISPADIDAMLSDPEIVQALSPEIKAALAQVRAQIGRS